jgi:hypothetical protein
MTQDNDRARMSDGHEMLLRLARRQGGGGGGGGQDSGETPYT